MLCSRSVLFLCLMSFWAFVGGIVGGWLSQEWAGPASAQSNTSTANADFNSISANSIVAGEIFVRAVKIVDGELNTIGSFYHNQANGVSLDLGVQGRQNNMVSLASGRPGSIFMMFDNEFKRSIQVKTLNNDPTMDFFYGNLSRLRLGTNRVVIKRTGDTHKVVGSVYTFDKNNNFTDGIPQR